MFYAACLLYCSSLDTLCYDTKSLDWLSLLLYTKQNFKIFFFTPSGYKFYSPLKSSENLGFLNVQLLVSVWRSFIQPKIFLQDIKLLVLVN